MYFETYQVKTILGFLKEAKEGYLNSGCGEVDLTHVNANLTASEIALVKEDLATYMKDDEPDTEPDLSSDIVLGSDLLSVLIELIESKIEHFKRLHEEEQ